LSELERIHTVKKASLLTLLTALALGPSALAQEPGAHPHPGFGPRFFAQLDANSDGQVSRDELHAGIQRRFVEIDADKNGKITESEVQQHSAEKMQERQEHGAEHLKAADKNHDGKWTKDELSRMPDGMFKKLDTNNDGVLTAAELEAGREGWKAHRDEFITHLFARADANSDGAVDLQEALSFADARFAKLDTNNDGVVTEDEWKAGHPGFGARAEHKHQHDG
jgi:Ca2+-binding EF-hand superfamily protein